MEVGSWRRAGREDLPALEAFLRGRERWAAGFIGRILHEGRLRLPAPRSGGVWIRGAAGSPVSAAVLGLPGGAYFPQLPGGEGDTGGLAEAMGGGAGGLGADRRPTTMIGPASSVAAFGRAISFRPEWRVEYLLMARPPGPPPVTITNYDEYGVSASGPADLDLLYPLQKAYEEEEVLTPLHSFDDGACRAFLAKSLREQVVVAALSRDGSRPRALGKAGTNARAFGLDQVGGVYVVPSCRGRGLGRALMVALLGTAGMAGRASALFVKKSNLAALRLYAGLGYVFLDDFRADYQSPR